MNKDRAIRAATERAAHTRRPWYAISRDGKTWEVVPDPGRAQFVVECDRHGDTEQVH